MLNLNSFHTNNYLVYLNKKKVRKHKRLKSKGNGGGNSMRTYIWFAHKERPRSGCWRNVNGNSFSFSSDS